MTQTLIIADLHLIAGETYKTNLFTTFCQQQANKVDQLFILGDLFDTWIGDDLSLKAYQIVISALKTLSLNTKIFIMTGNRDFLLGHEFVKKSGCTLIKSPYLLETNNQNYVLIHGDELCTNDKNYQQLKSVLQHQITKFIFLHLSKKLRFKISNKLRKKSVQSQQYKSQKIMDINVNTANELMHKYPDTDLIHGHTHQLNTHTNSHFTRHVLGDWSAIKGNAIKITNDLSRLEIS